MPKARLDQLLVTHGLAETRTKAQALILAGVVRVNGQVQTKAGTTIDDSSELTVERKLPYASRGGYKLAHALDTFGFVPKDLMALDVGASTGGFTDVLLQRGAAHVYAVDVGYGVLDWRLRQDARVTVLERTNIRYLEALPPTDPSQPQPVTVDCVTIDVSFISLKLVLPAIQRFITPDAWVIALIKPQFEAGPQHVGKGGVVRSTAVHKSVLSTIMTAAAHIDLPPHGVTRSPVTGPAGNVEFLAWLQRGAGSLDITQAIESVL